MASTFPTPYNRNRLAIQIILPWFLADRLERGVSFSSRVTAKDHLARLLDPGSVETLREAVHLAPDHAEATARLAREILAQKPVEYPHPEPAAAFLAERAARLAPDTLQTWWARAEVLARTNQFTEALAALERALGHAPRLPELWRLKAQWLEQSGQMEAALPAYTQAIALLDSQGGGPAPAGPGNLPGNDELPLAAQENSHQPMSAGLQISQPSENDVLKKVRLKRAELLARLGRHDESIAERLKVLGIPARDPATPTALVDLSAHYNLSFRDQVKPWDAFGVSGENLASLAPGERFLAGVRFDVRGAILAGNSVYPSDYAHLAGQVRGIAVHQHCRRLHFLHVIHYQGQAGVPTGRYVVHYEDDSREEIPIIHDQTIGYWSGGTGAGQGDLVWAWTGTDEQTPTRANLGKLYRYGWSNPKPDVRIETVDLEPPQSTGGAGLQAMLLVAITAQGEPDISITRQPQPQQVKLGQAATFRVEARSGAYLAYQWQFDESEIPGATNSTLTISSANRADAGRYTVQVRNSVVSPVLSLTSEPVALIITERDLAFGGMRREMFLNLRGVKLAELTNSVRFPGLPDSVGFISQFEAPPDKADHYGVRLTGFLLPPRTGEYRFYFNSDDEGALYLSTDDSPANSVLIAAEPIWNEGRRWTSRFQRSNAENVSAPIPLEAGRRYYVEARMKEGEGGDNLAVAWQMPGEAAPVNGLPPIPGRYLAVPAEWLESGK